MAIGKKTGGRNFEPGNKASPGRTPLPEDIKEARQMNKVELERILNRFLHMTKAEIAGAAKDPDATAIELLVASIISKAVATGDHVRLSWIADFLFGKLANKHELSGTLHSSLVKLLKESDAEDD